MNKVYHQTNRQYDSGARSTALLSLLSHEATKMQITNALLSTVNQTDKHLSTYVMDSIHDMASVNSQFR